MSEDPLARYTSVRDDVARLLTDLQALIGEHARWHDAASDIDALDTVVQRLRDGRFILAVVGEFSSGKSFLLNALLGKIAFEERAGAQRIVGLLATDINPSTATITELGFGEAEDAIAVYPDGREERVPLGRLSRFVAVGEEAKLHDATASERSAPELVRVTVDAPFLKHGFVVADTPGLASINPAHRRVTLGYLPRADAVLYLIDTQQPFTDGDAAFLGIIRRFIESIFIVQTKIDLWREREGDRTVWEHAAERIRAQTALHAPGVGVFPVSARDYAEGVLRDDAALRAASGFAPFLAALDASLVASAGGARIRRAAQIADAIASRAADAFALDAAARSIPHAELAAQRAAVARDVEMLGARIASAAATLLDDGEELRAQVDAAGRAARDTLAAALARAFDITDIARLRDRQKLHIIIDQTLATAIGAFAEQVAEGLGTGLHAAALAARADALSVAGTTVLAPLAAAMTNEALPLGDDVARAFDGQPGTGAWSSDVEAGVRSTIVFGALGQLSLRLVDAIAERFRSRPYGTYMKRELSADFRDTLGPAFDADIAAYVDDIAQRTRAAAVATSARIAALAPRIASEALGALDRALTENAADSAAAQQAAAARIARIATALNAAAAAFSGAGVQQDRARTASAIAVAATPVDDIHFDARTYEGGLVARRYRVVVVGAYKRGKSSLINALARERVLPDEGGTGELRFPTHVRYAATARVSVLSDDAGWQSVAGAALLEAGARAPVLVEVPWSLPPELVLVHAPSFDSGFPLAQDIAEAAAASATEIVALFSRQLSDRELDVYARIAALGKPLLFVHTIADNESATERRNVVMLAERYLRERGIVPTRLFTVSTRSDAAWNELGALRETLVSHAEEHMAHLDRADRERIAREALLQTPANVRQKRSLWDRLFGDA